MLGLLLWLSSCLPLPVIVQRLIRHHAGHMIVPHDPFTGFCAGLSSVAKMIDEHPNLCQSDEECMKKGSGNFCARYPNHYMDYGWCFNSGSEELKGFLAMPRAISK
ncbi:hypothetical protein ACSQ67_024220 [Phaseolus vulgaris]